MSSNLLSRNIKIKVYRTIICPFCMGVKLGLLTLREKLKLRVSENRVLRNIFGLKREEVTGEWGDCIMT